jgi:hypothetical protein
MKPAWMSEFHSENCKNIFDICTRFNMKLFTKDEAKSAIEKCNLSNKLNFKPSVQNTLANILKVDEVIFEKEPIIVEVEAEIKEVSEDKAIVETRLKGSRKKRTHEVVIEKENE